MNDGTEYDALITLKESTEHGHRIYSLELDEINKAALRWTVNDDGTLTPENEPSTGNKLSIRDNESKVKSTFERVQGSVFDKYRKIKKTIEIRRKADVINRFIQSCSPKIANKGYNKTT